MPCMDQEKQSTSDDFVAPKPSKRCWLKQIEKEERQKEKIYKIWISFVKIGKGDGKKFFSLGQFKFF